MRIFTDDPVVVARGTEYLAMVGVSYMFTAVVMIYSTSLRSTGMREPPCISHCFP
jgi:Na+-driven multidrug efflux pump